MLQQIIDTFKLSEQDIKAVYIFGSRLYGNFSKNSDYDLVVVYEKSKKSLETSKGNFEISFLSEKEYKNQINSHNAIMLTTLWVPDHCIIYENDEMKKFRTSFSLNKIYLQNSHLKEAGICISKSKRLFLKEKSKSLKNLVHAIRYLLFAKQILKNGKISDYSEANEIFHQLINVNYDTWDEYFNEFIQTMYKKLKSEVEE